MGDACGDAGGGASVVALEPELVLEGVEDGLDPLADLLQGGGAGSGCLVACGRAQQGQPGLVEVGLQVLGAVALVRRDRLVGGGFQPGEHAAQDLALVLAGTGDGPGHRQPGGGGDQVQAQAPEEARVGGAVPVAGPAGQVRALDGGPGAGAFDGGGVDQVHVVGVDAGGGSQPPDGAGQGAQALVVAGLARDVGEHASQVLAGVAQEASVGVDAHQRCDGGQGEDLGVGDRRGDPHPRAGRGPSLAPSAGLAPVVWTR